MAGNDTTVSAGRSACIALAALLANGCAEAPIPTVAHVDLERFMGRWYVLASIPTFLERGAHNAVEIYRRDTDGTIHTTFTLRRDAFDGELVEYRPRGFVSAESPAIWGMQLIWPIKAEYRIVYLDPDYSQTVIGRTKRDYVWLMGRTPDLAAADYERFLTLIGELGYDTTRVERIPHRW